MRVMLSTERLDDESFPRLARGILEALVPLARAQCLHLPPLLSAGVVYSLEDEGEESIVDPATVYRRKKGDCWQLTLWHVAELRNRGQAAGAHIYLVKRRPNGGRLWHVQTRLPSGEIFDTSRALGM